MENSKDNIWITSYPKSGNTWIQTVLKTAGKNIGFPQGELDVYKIQKMNLKAPECSIVNRNTFQNQTSVLKTHNTFSENMHSTLGVKTAGFCHIIRNPLDVLLSYINFTRIQYANNLNKQYAKLLFIDLLGFQDIIPLDTWRVTTLDLIPQYNLDAALNFFTKENGLIPTLKSMSGTWFEHVESWQGVVDTVPSITLRYEDLLGSDNYFLELTSFFEIPEDSIISAIKHVNTRDNSNRVDPNKPIPNIFYNKMTAYYYRNYFSKSAIDNFLLHHEEKIIKYGYKNL